MRLLIGWASALFCASTLSVSAAELYGPVLGDSEMTGIKVWIQTDSPAEVELTYWKKGTSKQYSTALKTTEKNDLAGIFQLNHLTPGSKYAYQLKVNQQEVKRTHPFSFSTQTYWQKRMNAPDFNFALGSCAYMNDVVADPPNTKTGGNYEIFESIYKQSPEMMLWMGDNVYLRPPDLYSKTDMSKRYQQPRRLKELQALFANVPQYAIWDDHDYGGNDGDRSYRMRESIYNVFKTYWPNPSFGLPNAPGVFTRFEKSDVEFFLTDNRYYRAPNALKDPNRTFFGNQQWQWLKDSLSSSRSTFKLVVLGNETLNTKTPSENMYSYSGAYKEFLAWLKTSEISGVVLLSGDRHHTELLKKERSGTYPLYEWCVSPLSSKAYPPYPIEESLAVRVPGSLYAQRNFGMVEVTGPPTDRKLILKRYTVQGKENWRYTIRAKDLVKRRVS